MQAYEKEELCSGCTACMNSCPVKAICMKVDSEGFKYPNTNEEICVNCGVCRTVCSFKDNYKIKSNLEKPDVYAVKHKSEEVRLSSSSGGIFTSISDYIIDKEGMIFGAAFDEQFNICHQVATTYEERNNFRGSKYVQSDLKEIFQEVKQCLISKKYVLFTGTPCQTAGLYNFLGENIDNSKLYTCDIVCHGTPSPKIYNDYKSFLEKNFNSKINEFTFRCKKMGWRSKVLGISFKNGQIYEMTESKDIFYQLFFSNLILRPSCYHCKFTNLHRPSDITIGDFWGIEKSKAYMDDDKGVSLALVNTTKGRELLEEIKNDIVYEKSTINDCMQPNLKQPSRKPYKREQFWNDYYSGGFKCIAKKYTSYGFVYRFKRNIIIPIIKKLYLIDVLKKIF